MFSESGRRLAKSEACKVVAAQCPEVAAEKVRIMIDADRFSRRSHKGY
jgi:hypothetical protein